MPIFHPPPSNQSIQPYLPNPLYSLQPIQPALPPRPPSTPLAGKRPTGPPYLQPIPPYSQQPYPPSTTLKPSNTSIRPATSPTPSPPASWFFFRALGSPFLVAGKSIAGNREVIYWEVIYRELGRSFPGIPGTGNSLSGSQEVHCREPGSHLPGTRKIFPGNKQVPKIHFLGTGKSNSGSWASYNLPSLVDSQPASHGIWPIYI